MAHRGQTTKYPGIYKLGPDHYRVAVSLPRDPLTGRYSERTQVVHGKISDARTAQAELRKTSQRHIKGNNWTMSELMAAYFDHVRDKKEIDTLKSDLPRWSVMEPGIGSKKIRSIKTHELDQLFDALARERGIKPQTVKRYRSVLSAAFKKATQWGALSINPVMGTTVPTDLPFEAEEVDLSIIEAVLNAYETKDPAMGDLLQITLLNQLRRGEICALQVGDYDGESQTLTIARTVVELKEKDGGGVVIKPYPKGRLRRTFKIDELTAVCLERQIGRLNAFAARRRDAFLFSDDNGVTPWRPGRVTLSQKRMRKSICPKCLVPGDIKVGRCQCGEELGVYFRVHDLRGYTTTALLDSGVNSKIVQYRGGWKDESVMRKHYNRKTEKAQEDATNFISEHFRKSS